MESTAKHNRTLSTSLPAVCGGMRWRIPRRRLCSPAMEAFGCIPYEPDHPRPTPAKDTDSRDAESGGIAAPHITTAPPTEARVGEAYVYQAKAYHSDVSGFTWYFEKPVPGMDIDRHSGKVTWTPSCGGHVEVAIGVRSVFGGESRQGWTICVHKAAPIRTPVPHPRFRAALLRKPVHLRRRVHPVWRINRKATRAATIRSTAPPSIHPRASPPLRI